MLYFSDDSFFLFYFSQIWLQNYSKNIRMKNPTLIINKLLSFFPSFLTNIKNPHASEPVFPNESWILSLQKQN